MPSRVNPAAPQMMMTMPQSTGMRTPRESKMRPESRPAQALMAAPGSSARPLTVAVWPSAPWM